MLQNKIAVVSRTFSKTPDLTRELQKHFRNVTFNADLQLKGQELIDFIADAEGAIVALENIDAAVINNCPKLKIISKYGVGLDNIDLVAAKKRGIEIGWTAGTNKLSVAEMTLSFMISLVRNLSKTSMELKRGVWDKSGGVNLSGRTIGIIGVGNVGKEMVRLLKPFNCKILVNDIIDQSEYYKKEGLEEVTKEELYQRSDIVTLHVPLTVETNRLINTNALALMRPEAYLINTSRGLVVDLADLKEALKSEKIAGAALDVYAEEPPKDEELLAFDNLICTPHIGGNSKESVLAMGISAIEHLKKFFS